MERWWPWSRQCLTSVQQVFSKVKTYCELHGPTTWRHIGKVEDTTHIHTKTKNKTKRWWWCHEWYEVQDGPDQRCPITQSVIQPVYIVVHWLSNPNFVFKVLCNLNTAATRTENQTHTHMHAYTRARARAHTHTHTHTHPHTHTHTHTPTHHAETTS